MVSDSRIDILYRYSQFSIDRNIDKEKVVSLFMEDMSDCECFQYFDNDKLVRFYYKLHKWESEFFCVNSIFLHFIDYESGQIQSVKNGIKSFTDFLSAIYSNGFILTIELPLEDNELIQILNSSRFRTVETRLHYLHNKLETFDHERYNVRPVAYDDINNLKNVASFMRNNYDRFHSDLSFNKGKADQYLSTYIENSILGFADLVITPNQENLPPDSFLTANICNHQWPSLGYPISKMILGAVSSKSNKGWLIKLISEMTYQLRDLGAKSIFMNSQATNIAVLISWEKLGYRIGRATHILSLNSND